MYTVTTPTYLVVVWFHCVHPKELPLPNGLVHLNEVEFYICLQKCLPKANINIFAHAFTPKVEAKFSHNRLEQFSPIKKHV